MISVNIVTSDRGWILERLASEITKRLDYVRHTDLADSNADINYYITYSCWSERVSRIQMAWFPHLEPLGEARDRFFSVAAAMDHSLTQARLYEDMLRAHGIADVSTASPGVDLDQFSPKLNIGVVGRTYHTGRKGEHIVGQLADMPEIEWHFTGTGWPGRALQLSDENLPKFYRDMDYILVPSLYEGGPMCVLEALASGTEVIAPPIGWVPDFPHIEFKTGDVQDLRRVLLELYAKKQKLRESVLDRTWEAWAQDHHTLFEALAKKHLDPDSMGGRKARTLRPRVGRAALVMHGNEASSQGGPSVRVPRTARELNRTGIRAETLVFNDTDLSAFNLVHVFNVWSPESALKALRQARRQNKPTVFSPIFLDLSERSLWDHDLLDVFRQADRVETIDARLADIAQRWAPVRRDPASAQEPVPGYFAMVREMVALADHLILLSDKEQHLLQAIGAAPRAWSIVHNPTESASFKTADPDLFVETYGIRDFVLCVGRVEARKNQLMLAHALRDTGIPLVLVGHTPSKEYRQLIERNGGDVHFLGRLQPSSDLLLSAFRAARVATLPSWSEGAPLAALEAGAAGVPLVLSDRSSEPEYFGALARYVDPADPASIRNAILDAFEAPRSAEMRAAQVAHVEANFGWGAYTAKTREVYETVAAAAQDRPTLIPIAPAPADATLRIVFDVTTTVGRRGRITGIARVELSLALELAELPDVDIRYVHWDNTNRRFVEISFDALKNGAVDGYRDLGNPSLDIGVKVAPGALFVVAGSGWMQNAVYAEGVVAFAELARAHLTVIVHDLIPVLFPYWFNDDYVPVFERNMRVMLGNADRLLAISETTRRDVKAVLRQQLDLDLEVATFREGDQIGAVEAGEASPQRDAPPGLDRFSANSFVLAVGALHARKNHRILYDVWVRLAEQLGPRCPALIIVGGVAWNGTELARSIRTDKRLKGKIVILEEVDDTGLDWLYRNCLFTAYPSLYEGWGLPVCESLRYGKICLAGDASSIREIAPEVTDLIDPLDFAAWLARVHFYVTSAEARRDREAAIQATYRPTPWSAAAAELAAKLRLPVVPNVERARYYLGARLGFTSGDNLRLHARGSWHKAESWGAWTAARTVALEFYLPTMPVRNLVLAMNVRGLPPAGGVLEVAVSINGRREAIWAFHNHMPQLRSVAVPRDAIGEGGNLRIEFASSDLFEIAEVTGSVNDRRRVGIGVASAALMETTRASSVRALLDPKRECEDALHAGERVNLLDGKRPARMFAGHWQKSSAWGTWGEKQDARLYINLDPLPAGRKQPGPKRLGFTIRAVATAERPLSVSVYANGASIADWRIRDSDLTECELTLPQELLAVCQPLELVFAPSERLAPKALGVGKEARPVSIGLFEVFDLDEASPPLSPAEVPVLTFNEMLAFKTGGASTLGNPAAAFLQRGWYGIEKTGVWSRGGRAWIAFQLDRLPPTGVTVFLSLRVLQTGRPEPRTVTAEANGCQRVTHTLAGDAPFVIALDLSPEMVGKDRLVTIAFEVDRPIAPSSISTSADDRLLGVQLTRIEVDSRLRIYPFRSYGIGEGGEATDALAEGWYFAEPTGRWSRPEGGRLSCIVAAGGEDVVTLVLNTRVYGTALGGPVEVTAKSQGKSLAAWTFDNDDLKTISLQAPLHRIGERFMLDVVLHQDRVFSPASQGAGDDTRDLGVRLEFFEVQTKRANGLAALERIDLLDKASDPYLRGAWVRSQGWGCWSPESSGTIVCLPEAAVGDVRVLDFTLRPVASPERPISVTTFVNGTEAAHWRFHASGIEVASLAVPAAIPADSPLSIRFAPTQGPTSPADLSAGPERRPFALGIYEFALRHGASETRTEPKRLQPGEALAFGTGTTTAAGDPIEEVLASGWFGLEAASVWTRGREGVLLFRIAGASRMVVLFVMQVRTLADKGRPIEISVAINGHKLASETVEHPNWFDLSVNVPEGCIGEDDTVRLEMASSEAVAPYAGGRSADDRLLGVQLAQLGVHAVARLVAERNYTVAGPFPLLDLCVEGWHDPEALGLWSRDSGGRIYAGLADVRKDTVEVVLEMRVFGTEITGPANVDVVGSDGTTIVSWIHNDDSVSIRRFNVKVDIVKGMRVIDLVLMRRGAISPKLFGFDDSRILGIWLSFVCIHPASVSAETGVA